MTFAPIPTWWRSRATAAVSRSAPSSRNRSGRTERTELWWRVKDNDDGDDTCERRAGGRVIPVVLLESV